MAARTRARSLLPIAAVLALTAGASGTASATDTAHARARYDLALEKLDVVRKIIARHHRRARAARKPHELAHGRARLLAVFADVLFPAWRGTPWDYSGTSTRPGQGKIACGYFVSTLLAHAGVKIERVRLAQQASELIVKTISGPKEIRRYRDRPAKEVIDDVRARGDGLYVVGLDNHVGFLQVARGEVSFCHASFVAPATATCEDPLRAAAFASRYRVVGNALSDRVVKAWLYGRRLKTRRR